jgi:hypothetical protein
MANVQSISDIWNTAYNRNNNMADKDKHTDVATLQVAQQKVAEPAYSIF